MFSGEKYFPLLVLNLFCTTGTPQTFYSEKQNTFTPYLPSLNVSQTSTIPLSWRALPMESKHILPFSLLSPFFSPAQAPLAVREAQKPCGARGPRSLQRDVVLQPALPCTVLRGTCWRLEAFAGGIWSDCIQGGISKHKRWESLFSLHAFPGSELARDFNQGSC